MNTHARLTETEIKLRLDPKLSEQVLRHPLVLQRLQGNWQHCELFNQYYDTPELSLDSKALALRLRRDGDQVIQTLKGRGQSVAGLSVRNEWDWYLDTEHLATELLQQPGLPTALASLDTQRLQPLFRTDFHRRKACLRWQRGTDTVEVELALDFGEVVSADKREPLSELELELRSGPPEALMELAVSLSETLPLLPWDSAKAERGFRLIDPTRVPALPPIGGWTLDTSINAILAQLTQCLIARAVCWSERLYLNDAAAPQGIKDTLRLMICVLEGQPQPAGLPMPLIPRLASLLDDIADTPDAVRTLISTRCDWGWLILSLSSASAKLATLAGPKFTDWKQAAATGSGAVQALIALIEEGAGD
ncbi:MAG: CYTH domain-containing protein [Oceanospirillales bacterium]|nr:CYTH domain-containing protein [Oceanospirillales bacterium]